MPVHKGRCTDLEFDIHKYKDTKKLRLLSLSKLIKAPKEYWEDE